MSGTQVRFKRYERPDNPPNVAVTNDDGQILMALYRHGVLDSAAVYRMLPHRSKRVLGNRLQKLFHAGYLWRLKQMKQIYVDGGGSLHDAYVLDTQGIEWLQINHQIEVPERHRRLQHRSASYLLHDIEAARFVLALRACVEARAGVEFLYLDEYYRRFAPDMLERDRIPARVSARVRWFSYNEVEGTIPDFQFVLYFPDREPGSQFRSFALEYCRANETVEPGPGTLRSLAFWKHTSLLRKFVVYAYAMKTGAHQEDFGMPLSHVLTVTQDAGKVQQMQSAIQKHLVPPPHRLSAGRFLFADMNAARRFEDILEVPLSDTIGDNFSLV